MSGTGSSWGRWPRHAHRTLALASRYDVPAFAEPDTFLPYGNGRSYGDSCQNDGGVLLATLGLDRYILFDDVSGISLASANLMSMFDAVPVAAPGEQLPIDDPDQ